MNSLAESVVCKLVVLLLASYKLQNLQHTHTHSHRQAEVTTVLHVDFLFGSTQPNGNGNGNTKAKLGQRIKTADANNCQFVIFRQGKCVCMCVHCMCARVASSLHNT